MFQRVLLISFFNFLKVFGIFLIISSAIKPGPNFFAISPCIHTPAHPAKKGFIELNPDKTYDKTKEYDKNNLILYSLENFSTRREKQEEVTLFYHKLIRRFTELLVIYDDMDLMLGEFRFKSQGSSAGQKGIDSIIYHLKTDQFCRLKIETILLASSSKILLL